MRTRGHLFFLIDSFSHMQRQSSSPSSFLVAWLYTLLSIKSVRQKETLGISGALLVFVIVQDLTCKKQNLTLTY